MAGGENCDGVGDGEVGRLGAALPAAGETVVQGPANVGHAEEGTGGVVPDELRLRDGLPSLQECHRPRPLAQFGPLHGPGLPANHTPV